MTSSLVKDDKDRPVCIIATCIDITERKRVEKVLQQFSEELKLKVEERTKELQKRLKELEIYYDATIGREGRIIELKQKVNELLEQLGKEKKYDV